jgi:hypothetical protein
MLALLKIFLVFCLRAIHIVKWVVIVPFTDVGRGEVDVVHKQFVVQTPHYIVFEVLLPERAVDVG